MECIQKHLMNGMQLKLVGNERLKTGKIAEAREAYVEALRCVLAAVTCLQENNNSFLAVQADIEVLRVQLVSNLALTEIKLELWPEALEHASLVLAADPGNSKALFRRATARIRLGQHLDSALRDLTYLLQQNEKSIEIKGEMAFCKQKMADSASSTSPFEETLKRRMRPPKQPTSFLGIIQSWMDTAAFCGGKRG